MHRSSRILAMSVCAFIVIAGSAAADNVTFNYQGRVRVQGNPFTGSGQFKFALVNTSGTATLWSNDGTSVDGNEPTAFLTIPVADGVFSIEIGDTAIPGMQAVAGAIFAAKTPLKLRVWFNDGSQGFQKLTPDQNLEDVTLNTVQTGKGDYTIYVNGSTGNDERNGLTPATAKKTIQAAVDAVPDRVRCNITIDVAAGVYRELVEMDGMMVRYGKTVKIIGDKTWTPSSGGSPSVRITGADSDATHARVRGVALHVNRSTNIVLQGLLVDYCSSVGLLVENGTYTVTNCKATNCYWAGIQYASQARGGINTSLASNNDMYGFYIAASSTAMFTNCTGSYNGYGGIGGSMFSVIQMRSGGDYSHNGTTGINTNGFVYVDALPPTITFNNNGQYGVTVGENSLFFPNGAPSYTGNPGGNIAESNGGKAY